MFKTNLKLTKYEKKLNFVTLQNCIHVNIFISVNLYAIENIIGASALNINGFQTLFNFNDI